MNNEQAQDTGTGLSLADRVNESVKEIQSSQKFHSNVQIKVVALSHQQKGVQALLYAMNLVMAQVMRDIVFVRLLPSLYPQHPARKKKLSESKKMSDFRNLISLC